MPGKITEIEKADLLGERLVGGATEIAISIVEELGKRYGVCLRDSDSAPQFIIEVIVFHMHLVDRMAFSHLDPVRREAFGDRLVLAVLKESLREIRHSSPEALSSALQETYNRRQVEYARYRVLISAEDELLKDTLYWEFSKILFGFLDNQNPARLMFLNQYLMRISNALLNAMETEEVLRS